MDTYSRSRVPRNGVATNPVELKPSASERDENRNETVHITTATLQEPAKQNDSTAPAASGSPTSSQRSSADERSRPRSVGPNQGDGKKSSVWYEYGCV